MKKTNDIRNFFGGNKGKVREGNQDSVVTCEHPAKKAKKEESQRKFREEWKVLFYFKLATITTILIMQDHTYKLVYMVINLDFRLPGLFV